MTAPAFAPVGHDDLVADIGAVADRLTESGWRPDFVVGIGRGGLVPAVYLSHRTGIPVLSVDHSSGIEAFGPRLLEVLAARAAAGERLLLVDDINDSGRTIRDLRGLIADAGGAGENVRTAVLITNVRSVVRVDYWSREIDRAVDKSWFVFPWESVAPAETLAQDAAAVPERLG